MLFKDTAVYYEKLESTSSRLEMIETLSELFSKSSTDEIRHLIYITQGVLSPSFEGVVIGLAESFAEQAIAAATGYSKDSVIQAYKKTGDLGAVAEDFCAKSKLKRISSKSFTVNDVFESMHKIARTGGQGSQDMKIKMLMEILSASSPLEARYVTRFALGRLRLGLGDATILEALSKAFTGSRESKPILENAYNICSDLGRIGEIMAEKGIKGVERIEVQLFSPIRPALAERLPTAEQILEKTHGKCAIESKYDGLRQQIHMDRKRKKVEIYSRNLEVLTPMFPEIVDAALDEISADSAIIEGEAIGYNEATDQFLPFQETIQRKRKHGIEEMSKEMPLTLFSFDIMYLNGKDTMSKPYSERRELLESVLKKRRMIRLSDRIVTDDPKKIDQYFNTVIEDGLEGIMAKDLGSSYVAGARKFSWIKLKRSYKGELSDTLDLVILGYFLGKGLRAEFKFGGLLAGVYNDKEDIFETITRIGTGFSEAQMKSLKKDLDEIKTKHKPARVNAVVEPDFWVEPKYVVTVRADEITRSNMHTCGIKDGIGYALRFPRLVSDGIRQDKSASDATTTEEVIEMFGIQRKSKLSG
jgi:DNA ligase-1